MTIVGEHGLHLSSSQKTRIALARLFLSNPKVVIFDVDCVIESETDVDFRDLVLGAISNMAKSNVTVIVLTSSKRLLEMADIICAVGEQHPQ